jgi:hypothetical protein
VKPFPNPLDWYLPAKSEVGDGNVVQDNAELLCPRGQLLKKKMKNVISSLKIGYVQGSIKVSYSRYGTYLRQGELLL